MSGAALDWNINLRTNLVLWPEPGANISALALQDGQPYDETALLKTFRKESPRVAKRPAAQSALAGAQPSPDEDTEGKVPNTTRAVRNTFEAMALEGLAYRAKGDVFELTDLGRCCFSFLGVGQERAFANANNRALLGEPLVRGLSVVAEYRTIWRLMRAVGDKLTNEELNRALNLIKSPDAVTLAAERVLKAREQGDPKLIGPRIYHDDRYDSDPSEQRKAMNPQFLITGGGGIIINVDGTEEMRWLEPWAVSLIDHVLGIDMPEFHASTAAASALRISANAVVPPRMI